MNRQQGFSISMGSGTIGYVLITTCTNTQTRHPYQQWEEIYIVSFRGKEFLNANYVADGMNSFGKVVSRIKEDHAGNGAHS